MSVEQLDQIIENLVKELPVKSIHLKTTVQQSKMATAKKSTEVTEYNDYIQTTKGERFYDRTILFSGMKIHRAAYCDGARCATVRFNNASDKPAAIVVTNKFLDDMGANSLSIPLPFRAYYVGPKPLIEELSKARRMPDGNVLGRPCNVFLFESVGPPSRKEDFTYHLDKETAVPLRVACYSAPEHLKVDRPYWSWEATTFDEVAGHHVPLKSRETIFDITNLSRDVNPKVNITSDITVDVIEFDHEFAKAAFWPAEQEKVHMIDRLHRSPPAGRAPGKAVPAPGKTVQATDPIRVSDSGSAPWFWFGGVSLVAAMIFGSIAVYRRTS